jgi:Trk-type K+ transport system membrane component
MAIVLIALLIVVILGGLGFAIHVLWWIAIAALVIWLLGFLLRAGETVARPRRRRRRRWYYW